MSYIDRKIKTKICPKCGYRMVKGEYHIKEVGFREYEKMQKYECPKCGYVEWVVEKKYRL